LTDDAFWQRPAGSKRERAAMELERLNLGAATPDHPAVVERKARERAEQIARHDAFFRVTDRGEAAMARALGYSSGDGGQRDD
jgi:hypothetical protein